MKWALSALAISIVAAAHPAPSLATACDIPIAEEAKVVKIVDGATLDLADGRRVRLAAVEVLWPDLASLLENRTIALAFAEKAVDRHGDLLAHLFADGEWLQGKLVDAGAARVQTRSDMRRCARELLVREAEARAVKRGLWADPLYRIRKPDELAGDIGTFQIVEGKVLAVAASRDRTFVNFGTDRRTDFTVTISAADRKRFAKEGVDPASWVRKTVRVRGWLSLLNGPELELTHPEQIELLE